MQRRFRRRSVRREAKLLVAEVEFHFGLRQCLGKMIFLHRDQPALLDRHGVPVDHIRKIFGAIDLPADGTCGAFEMSDWTARDDWSGCIVS